MIYTLVEQFTIAILQISMSLWAKQLQALTSMEIIPTSYELQVPGREAEEIRSTRLGGQLKTGPVDWSEKLNSGTR